MKIYFKIYFTLTFGRSIMTQWHNGSTFCNRNVKQMSLYRYAEKIYSGIKIHSSTNSTLEDEISFRNLLFILVSTSTCFLLENDCF